MDGFNAVTSITENGDLFHMIEKRRQTDRDRDKTETDRQIEIETE